VELLLPRSAMAGLRHGSGSLGSVDIFVRSGLGIDPYFGLLMSNLPIGWQREWFFLWNDVDALLPMFTGNHPVP
jgi:hypothetical protein